MTQEEEIISNLSYVSSDFRTIYPQLLDTAKKLTNKWDPSLSNESDPGNILIKEAAIVGDKNNYHIDKNVLECFPVSATQEASARQLYDLAGYNMHWYRSAKGQVTFNLIKTIESINNTIVNSDSENNEKLSNIVIKAGTAITDASGEYVYSLLESTEAIDTINRKYIANAIQGIINKYEINGNSTITIDNLDENLRIYLPDNVVAENGVFVYDDKTQVENVGFINDINATTDTSAWALVDNLTKYPSGSKVFKFGIDFNSNSCYIQFPQDIISSQLIESGLNIYYTSTIGARGNLKKGILNKFLNTYEASYGSADAKVPVNDYIVISNLATTGGKDPETLQSAYNNYKKLIGTYDTLVTRRDYENAIYNLNNEAGTSGLISNALVTDRTNDINYSQKVIEGILGKDFTKNYVYSKDDATKSKESIIKPYDVILYLLKAPVAMNTTTDYDTSFEPDLDGSTKSEITNELDELKSVQHNLWYIPQLNAAKNILNITNLCKLKGSLTTYYKVSQKEANEIQDNVIKALVTNYNSRAIDFGNALDYNDLINTIKSADDRIRTISLDMPTYEPILKYSDANENIKSMSLYVDNDTKDATKQNNDTLAKMILAGNVQLFKFQDDFRVDFGQTNTNTYRNVPYISTSNPIELSTTEQVLKPNDIIQIVQPNLITTKTYAATVKYAANFIGKEGINVLKDDEKLKLIYLDSATGASTSVLYTKGTVINLVGISSLSPLSEDEQTRWNEQGKWNDNASYKAILSAGQSIEEKQISQIKIKKGTPYYIITNQKTQDTYELIIKKNESYILQDNEYLLYTNSDLDAIVSLGSGTTLINKDAQNDLILKSPFISISDALNTPVEDAGDKWQNLPNDLNAQENTIINLVEGSSIKISKDTFSCENNLKPFTGEIIYKLTQDSKEEVVQQHSDISGYTINIRSNMVLAGNSIVPQTLYGDQKVFILNAKKETIGTIIAEQNILQNILYNYPINMAGGDNLDVSVLDSNSGKYLPNLDIYTYTSTNMVNEDQGLKRDDKGVLTLDAKSTQYTLNFTFEQLNKEKVNGIYILPVQLNLLKEQTLTITGPEGSIISDTFKGLKITGEDKTKPAEYSGPINKAFNLIIDISQCTGDLSNLTIHFTNPDESKILIGYIRQITSLNTSEINSEDIGGAYYKYDIGETYDDVITSIESKCSNLGTSYDWTYQPALKNKVLQPISAQSYFNTNHIYNKCTISKINFEKSSIKVNSLSIE